MRDTLKKKSTLWLLFLLLLPAWPVSCAFRPEARDTAGLNPCKGKVVQRLARHAGLSEDIPVVAVRAVGDLCELMLRLDGKLTPVYVGQDFALVGDLYRESKAVTRERLAQFEKHDLADMRTALSACTALRYTPHKRNLKRTIYMLSDPRCPHCHEALSQVETLAERYGVTFDILLFSYDRDTGRRLAAEAACRRMDLLAYEDFCRQGEAPETYAICDTGKAREKAAFDLARKLDIPGVPFFIFGHNGKQVAGANMKKLEHEILAMMADMETEAAQ